MPWRVIRTRLVDPFILLGRQGWPHVGDKAHVWKTGRGRQAGPGQAEDTQEKKSTGDTTGHGVLDGANTTVERGGGTWGGMEEKVSLGKEVGKRLQKTM